MYVGVCVWKNDTAFIGRCLQCVSTIVFVVAGVSIASRLLLHCCCVGDATASPATFSFFTFFFLFFFAFFLFFSLVFQLFRLPFSFTAAVEDIGHVTQV